MRCASKITFGTNEVSEVCWLRCGLTIACFCGGGSGSGDLEEGIKSLDVPMQNSGNCSSCHCMIFEDVSVFCF